MTEMNKAPTCSCGISMVLRKRKTGHKFYSCAKFGKGGCSETANTSDDDYSD